MAMLDGAGVIRSLSRHYAIEGDGYVEAKLAADVAAAEEALVESIRVRNPFAVFRGRLEVGRGALREGGYALVRVEEAVAGYLEFAAVAEVTADAEFWREEVGRIRGGVGEGRLVDNAEAKGEAGALFGLLLEGWAKELADAEVAWRGGLVRAAEARLGAELRGWLDVYFHKFGAEGIIGGLRGKYPRVVDDEVVGLLSEKIGDAERGGRVRLLKEGNPYEAHLLRFKAAQGAFNAGIFTLDAIRGDVAGYRAFAGAFGRDMDEGFWEERIGQLESVEAGVEAEDKAVRALSKIGTVRHSKKQPAGGEEAGRRRQDLRRYLQERWGKALEVADAEWRMAKLDEYRRELVGRLEAWLRLLEDMRDVLSQLSVSPGVFWDLSKGGIYRSDVEALRRWAAYLQEDDGVRALCEMLGRLRTAARAKREELVQTTEIVRTNRVDVDSREEIAGVTVGDSVAHALPAEKGLLADPDTELLFYVKLAEKRLLQFEMRGVAAVEVAVEKEERREVGEDEKKGPVIVCVDTSGSMQGAPETIAKAVALYLTVNAKKENRACYLINFSTAIETLDLSGAYSLANLIEFLGRSFCGGTDAAPAIGHALAVMQESDYARADLLVVSDFVMGDLSAEVMEKIGAARARNNRFYSLAIGGNLFLNNRVRDKFDKEWVYNPSTGGVRQLLDFVDGMGG